MVIILRHDVDNPYFGDKEYARRLPISMAKLNFAKFKIGRLFPGWRRWGYLEAARSLFEAERALGLKGTWFFSRHTKPYPKLREELIDAGFEIAFHASRTEKEADFIKDLTYTMGSLYPLGFSKHGNAKNWAEAKRKNCEIYNPEECLRLAIKCGFKYFSGNETNPENQPQMVGSIIYFPSAYWMIPGYMDDKKYTLKWLIDNSKDKYIVVLIHPREYTDLFPNIKKKIDRFFGKVEEVISFSEFLKKLHK